MMEFESLVLPELDSDLPSDLDLIEVLWRQDVDLGVGKEVFDINLRRELQQERELEKLKEQEKIKEIEKRERERKHQTEQWLAQNFVRDGETGEWMPINGTNNTETFSPPAQSSLYPDLPAPADSVSLADALSLGFLEDLPSVNHTYGQPPQPVAGSNQSLPIHPSVEADFAAGKTLMPEVDVSQFAFGSQRDQPFQDRLEQNWQEIVGYLAENTVGNDSTTTGPASASIPSSTATTATATTTLTMPPVETQQMLAAPEADFANFHHNLNTLNNHHHHHHQQQLHQQPQLPSSLQTLQNQQQQSPFDHHFQPLNVTGAGEFNMNFSLGPPSLPQSNASLHTTTSAAAAASSLHANGSASMLASASMNETCQLLHEASGGPGDELESLSATLANQTGMVLQNVTLAPPPALLAPHPVDGLSANLSSLLDVKPFNSTNAAAATCSKTMDFNSTNPADSALSSLDWDGELLFHNITELTNSMADTLDPADILNTLDMTIGEGLDNLQMLDDSGSDSAISMGSGSPTQEVNETADPSPFDGIEGATGGSDYEGNSYNQQRTHTRSSGSGEDDGFHYSCSSYGSPASVLTNCSTGSNDTEHAHDTTNTAVHRVHHNHTYPTQPGQTPREVKKYAKKEGRRQKGPQSRDAKRAEDCKLPFTFDRIIECPVEEFNELLTKTDLTEAQTSLMRDIRRRGKNKVAAQNCRKRKLDVLVTLEDEMGSMQHARDKLAEERRNIDAQMRQAKEKYNALYQHIFRSLRDDHGRPYDPSQYSLQESSDGNVFLVHSTSANAVSSSSSGSSSSSSSSSSSGTAGAMSSSSSSFVSSPIMVGSSSSSSSSTSRRRAPPSSASKSKMYGPQKKRSK